VPSAAVEGLGRAGDEAGEGDAVATWEDGAAELRRRVGEQRPRASHVGLPHLGGDGSSDRWVIIIYGSSPRDFWLS
jgi:hypothetical protein